MGYVPYNTASLTNGQTTDLASNGYHTGRFMLSGTWTGSIYAEGSIDNITWITINIADMNALDGQLATYTQVNSNFIFNCSGFNFTRIRAALSAGTTDVTFSLDDDNSMPYAIASTLFVDQVGGHTFIVDGSGITQPVSATSLPLPTGAATSAKQDTGNTSVASIDTKLPSGLTVTSSRLQVELPPGGGGLTDTELRATAVPISASSLPLPTGAATSALQTQPGVDIGDVTVNNAAGVSAVNIQDGGNSITIDGSVGITGSVAVTNAGTFATQATQAGTWNVTNISGTVSLPTGASTSALQTTGNTSVSSIDTKTPALGQALAAASVPVVLTAAQITTLTPLATVATTNAGTFAVQVSSALPTGANTIGALTANQSVNCAQVNGVTLTTGNGIAGTGVQRVTIASDNTAFSVNATGPTLTKGTQAATGYSVQNLKDAGRTTVRYYAVAAAAGTTTTETAISLTKSSGTGATSAAVSHTPASGKTFRIIAITFATRGHSTATAQTTTFNFRINTSGAVVTTSTPIILAMRSATPATASAWDRVYVGIPDGMEIPGDGTLQFGITAAATYTTNAPTWDVTIIGFEY